MSVIFGDRPITLARELTKLHETVIHSSAKAHNVGQIPVKGEFTIVLGPILAGASNAEQPSDEEVHIFSSQITNNRHVSRREALSETGLKFGLSTNNVLRDSRAVQDIVAVLTDGTTICYRSGLSGKSPMAKQRRASSRSIHSKQPASSPTSSARPSAVATQAAGEKPLRPGYVEAVALYEQGVAGVQAHDYSRASSVLRSVLSRYPEEKELHERVRLYINVCDRHMTPRAVSPSTPEERVFAATLAVNTGNYDEALEHLRRASTEAPDHDHALYMLASVLALRDEVDEAVLVLLRAIELNPENRAMARHDPDLEPLRQYDNVRAALEPSSPRRLSVAKPRRSR